MLDYEYTGNALHTLANAAPIIEHAPADLGLIAAGGHAATGAAAHAAVALGGKTFATIAGTATLASGVVFGNQVVAPAFGQMAQDARAAAIAEIVPEGGSVTEDGTVLNAEGEVVAQLPPLATDPINLIASAISQVAAVVAPALPSDTEAGANPIAALVSLVTGSPTPQPDLSTASPLATTDPSAVPGATSDPSAAATLTLAALPVLDFGTTSTATTGSGSNTNGSSVHGAAGAAAGSAAGSTSTSTIPAEPAGATAGKSGNIISGASASAGHSSGTTSTSTTAAAAGGTTGSTSGTVAGAAKGSSGSKSGSTSTATTAAGSGTTGTGNGAGTGSGTSSSGEHESEDSSEHKTRSQTPTQSPSASPTARQQERQREQQKQAAERQREQQKQAAEQQKEQQENH